MPALRSGSNQRPWVGENFTLSVTGLPAAAPVIVLLGRSRSSWGSVSLPFPLDSLGMTGCTLFVSGELVFALPSSAGVAHLTLPIPGTSSLVGIPFVDQALVLDPPANTAGVTVSNAGDGRIGAK